MSWSSRVFLMVAALSSALSLAALGVVFSSMGSRHGDPVHGNMWLLAVGGVLSFPFWLPVIIPNGFRLLARVVRWICASIVLFPIFLSGSVVTHNLSRFPEGWQGRVAESLLVVACFTATIVVLVWPELRRWLRPAASAADQKAEATRTPIWEKVLVGLGAVFCLVFMIQAAEAGYFIYDLSVSSELEILNWSGSDVRFEKVTIDGQSVWGKPDVIVKTLRNFEKPWLDTNADRISLRFRAPRKNLELKLVTLNAMHEGETVSCTLNNAHRPCSFEVIYYKGKLAAHDRRDGDYIKKRGPYGEGDVGHNWPNVEWPKGPYKQPIK